MLIRSDNIQIVIGLQCLHPFKQLPSTLLLNSMSTKYTSNHLSYLNYLIPKNHFYLNYNYLLLPTVYNIKSSLLTSAMHMVSEET